LTKKSLVLLLPTRSVVFSTSPGKITI
jgi:hypothetical protein